MIVIIEFRISQACRSRVCRQEILAYEKSFNATSVHDQSSNLIPEGGELTFQRSIHPVKEKTIERIR
jgi:hypothetical protein